MSWWHVGAVANLALLVTYLAIAFGILRSLIPQQRWRSNPLAVATVATPRGLVRQRCCGISERRMPYAIAR